MNYTSNLNLLNQYRKLIGEKTSDYYRYEVIKILKNIELELSSVKTEGQSLLLRIC